MQIKEINNLISGYDLVYKLQDAEYSSLIDQKLSLSLRKPRLYPYFILVLGKIGFNFYSSSVGNEK